MDGFANVDVTLFNVPGGSYRGVVRVCEGPDDLSGLT
jgi:hypothetical protein